MPATARLLAPLRRALAGPSAPLRAGVLALACGVAAATPRAAGGQVGPALVLPDSSVELVAPAAATVETGRAQPARPFARLSASASGLLDSLVSRARGQLGTRYVLGGATPGRALDCSSFARYVMESVGVRLPRTAAQQARLGTAVPRDRERLKPGDLLTFRRGRRVSHVGIYLGEGRFIHASPTSGRVIETTFDRNPSLLRRWSGARRLIASQDTATASGGS